MSVLGPPLAFTADHPFILLILDEEIYTVLSMGLVMGLTALTAAAAAAAAAAA